MAGELLIIPSSSPPRPFATFSVSSSSPLPPLLSDMQHRPQAIRTGSRAAPIPDHVSASFTSAASLLKSTPSLDAIGAFALKKDTTGETKSTKAVKARKAPAKKADTESKVTKKPRTSTTTDGEETTHGEKKIRKPRAKKTIENDGEVVEKPVVARKPRAKKAETDELGNAVTKDKPARKPRAKKVDGDAQPKLPKGKVTKKSIGADGKLETTKSKVVKAELDSSLDLEMAIKRRVDWTPPVSASKVAGITETILSSGAMDSDQKRTGFADLFGSYGFTKLESASSSASIRQEVTRKRKLIELVKTSVATSAAISPVAKEKAPKKKAKTITEQATSAYVEEEELPVAPAPLLQYFSVETAERTTSDGFKVPSKPRSKSPVKSTSKSRKGSAQAPILLSPESAMKQVGNQDFVFGTSSQLAREDSPTLLRDLHAAMQASNEEEDPFADSVFDSSPPVPKRRSGIATKRNLWSAASRDDSGDLLDVPMIDLVDSPAINNSEPTLPASIVTPVQSASDVWHDIGTTSPAKPISDSPKILGPIEAAIRTELLSSPSGNRQPKSPKVPKKAQQNETLPTISSPSTKAKVPKSPAKSKKTAGLQMPNYAAYTDAQLTKEIASYKFKPIKKRDQMILLLQRCWKSKNELALSALSTNLPVIPTKVVVKDAVPAASQLQASPKRPRGRPRKENTVQYLAMDSDTPLSQSRTPKKASKKAKQTTEDISNSETHVTPSPPRHKASKISPLPLKTAGSESDSPELSPIDEQELLFKYIHRAVTEAPRSKDPFNPSWHEKILLYDPIVLEDLTAWLNTGGLETVGWDFEVDPKLVKKWCESKSICCLWRENLRGGARSRY